MIVGIDLGTTYCCAAYFDEAGRPQVIPNAEGEKTTPSVVYFDGKQACAGEPANQRKNQVPQHQIFDLFKPDMGKGREKKRYTVGREHYGPEGISALLLRKIKRDVIDYLRREGPPEAEDLRVDDDLKAVITVPAYFRDKERRATRLAGYAAGIDVVHIINEPTAASLAHSLDGRADSSGSILAGENKRLLVFDLGGGTCDVTILGIHDDEVEVIATEGDDELGGQHWDKLIVDYLTSTFWERKLIELSDEDRFTLQHHARRAKHDLTDQETTDITLEVEEGTINVTLHRTPPDSRDAIDIVDSSNGPKNKTSNSVRGDGKFYFEKRAEGLLVRCKNLCRGALEEAGRKNSAELGRTMRWGDIDEIVMTGGSCRMPMIPKMLEAETGHRPRRVETFGYDVAVAVGAAYHGAHQALKADITDVVPSDIGVEVLRDGRRRVRHLVRKNTPLPAFARQTFDADADADLIVYEGESQLPEQCDRRGTIDLKNDAGDTVTVELSVDEEGVLTASADYPPHGNHEVKIKNVLYDFDEWADPLREKVHAVSMSC